MNFDFLNLDYPFIVISRPITHKWFNLSFLATPNLCAHIHICTNHFAEKINFGVRFESTTMPQKSNKFSLESSQKVRITLISVIPCMSGMFFRQPYTYNVYELISFCAFLCFAFPFR